jgi:hypothetical protein
MKTSAYGITPCAALHTLAEVIYPEYYRLHLLKRAVTQEFDPHFPAGLT